MDRASEALKAERLNHARKLLQRFDHLPDAVAQMVKDCGLSPRQVYRYLQQARRLTELSQLPAIFGIFGLIFIVKSCVSIAEL